MPYRSRVNQLSLSGQLVTASPAAIFLNGVPVGGGAGYSTVQDEGSPLPQRTTLNFVGAGVTVSDAGGLTQISVPGGAGGGGVGTTLLDFGAFPGASDASTAIIGQSAITTGSIVEAWVYPRATADHSADEHMVETLKVMAGNIAPGTGFTIYGLNTNQINETSIPYRGTALNAGIGPLVYGKWTVAWQWQ